MPAAIGFTVKSGWACAVLLTGSATSPRVVDSQRLELSDPDNPQSRQPYHAGFGTARDSGPERTKLVSSVKRYGRQSMTRALQKHQAAGHTLRGAGVVVGSLIEPATIANDHIRIHALEGQLFRGIVQDALARYDLPSAVWRERDLYGAAVEALGQPEPALRQALAAFGQDLDGPWRAEQKSAALAAWLVLAGRAARRTR
jgi:hypothetical protein